MATFDVIRPGLQTTVQDLGRWGYQAEGVPVAGPMDERAHRVANALVGNPREAATLEVTLLGPELHFDEERTIAVAGAEFEVTVNGHTVAVNAPVVVPSGGTVKFGPRFRGARAYVAVAGGVEVPPIFGSRATHLISAMGGMAGRALIAGDRMPLGQAPTGPLRPIAPSAIAAAIELPDHRVRIRVLPGPQDDYFGADALDALQSGPYTIDQRSDRMGYRLVGPKLVHTRGADLISDAAPLGSMQVPASQQPILLMADRQTTGGYPKIATVISADVALAGQLGPGDRIDFIVTTRREAAAALIALERRLMAVEGARS